MDGWRAALEPYSAEEHYRILGYVLMYLYVIKVGAHAMCVQVVLCKRDENRKIRKRM